MKKIKLSINEIRHKIEIKTSGTKINLLQTWGAGPDIGPAGERKVTAATKLATAASTGIDDGNAPRRKKDHLEAHRNHRRRPIFDRRMDPHAPPIWRVGAEGRCRVLTTRQCCRREYNKKIG